MNDITHILIVEDLISDFELAQREIRKSLKNCVFERVERPSDFLKALEDFQPDLILSDYKLPSFDGMKALDLAQKHTPSTPFLIWSAEISEDAAVECMKKGASNYIFKENLKRLGPAVVHALEERQLLLEHKQAEARYQAIFENSLEGIYQSTPDGHFINVNPAMARIYGYDSPQEMIKSVANITRQLYIDPAEHEKFAELLQTRKAIENHEGRNYRKDGSIIWTSTSARIVHDNDGNVLYYEGFLQDITERKQAEDALKNNERRFRALTENGLDSISLLAPDGTLQWESPAITRILDFAPGEFLGHNIFELMHPDDLVWTQSAFTTLLEEPGSRQHKSFRLRHSNGSWRFVEAVVTNMLDEPSVNAIVVNYRDVTERKRAEEAMLESEAKYRLLFENNPLPMWIYDLETLDFLKVNDAAIQHYGYSVDEFRSMTIQDIRPSEDIPKLLENIANSAAEIRSIDSAGIWRHCKKDGTVILVEIISHPVEFAGKKAELVLTTDVTERKQAEEALRESQSKYQNLVETSHDLIWSVDAESRITFLNRAAKEIYGYEPQELIGRSFLELMDPQHHQLDLKNFKAAVASADEFSEAESYIRHRDGRQIILSANSIVLRDENGIVIGVTGSSRDITERKQTDTERQALLEIMQGLANTNDLQEFLKLIHGAIARVIYAENFFVVLHEQESGLFEEIYSVDQYDPPALPSSLEKSVTSYVFRTGESLLLTQERFDELVAQGDVELVGTNSASWLGAPLKTLNGTIGVIAVQNYENRHCYTENDKDFLASIATQVALAIERKRAEETLRESEERYRLFVENSGEAILVTKPDGTIDSANPEACRIFGRNEDEFKSLGRAGVVDINDPRLRSALDERRRTGRFKGELNLLRKDGTGFPSEVSTTVFKDSHGNERTSMIIRDITERKQAEDLVRESGARLAEAQVIAKVGSWETDLATLKVIWSEEIYRIFELDTNTFHASHPAFLDFVHPEDRKKVDDAFIASLENDSYNKIEHRFITSQGKIKFIEERWQVLHDTQGRPWRAVGTCQDITERKQAEEMLRESEERFSSSFEYASIGIALVTLEGQWFKVNHALCDLLGYSEAELLTLTFQAITHPDDLESDLNHVRQLLTGKINSYQTEKRYFQKLGHVISVLLSVSLVRNNEGKPLYFISQIQDITERKRAEDAEREQRALAEALRDTAETLNSTLDYGEVLDRILAAVARVVPHNAATIMLIDGDSAHVVRSHGYHKRGLHDEIMGVKLPLAETNNLRHMLETGQTVIVYDTHSSSGWKRLPITDWLRSNVGAPISIYGKVIGFILLDSETVGFFTPVHAKRLEAFANQAALAIHNANMLQQAQEEIAERKRAEAELRASEERFRQLADNIEEVFWMTDAESGREIYMSPAAEKVWGRSLDYLMNEPNAFINTVLPEDQPAVLHALQQEKDGGKVEVEYRVVDADGSIRWIWDRAFPIFDEDGRVKTLAGIAADITERKQAENNTQHHLAELQALYENGLAVGQLLEPRQIGNRVIETFARHLSWHHVTIRLLRPETDDLDLIAFNQPGLSDEEKLAMERHFNSMINKVGQGLSGWVVQTGEPLRTGNVHSKPQYVDTHAGTMSGLYMPLKVGERIIGCISVESEQADAFTAQDERLLATLANQAAIAFENARLYNIAQQELLERKRAQDALWVSETHYRELADSITDILIEMDHEKCYTHWNKATEMLTGILSEDAIGRSMLEVFGDSEEQTRIGKIYESVLQGRQARTFETEIIVKGQPRAFEVNAYPSTRGVAVVAKDVTERKQMESALADERNQLARRVEERTADLSRANSNLARALLVKDEFLANMSHELRTPLNAILGLSESLGEQVAGPLNEKQQKYLTTINESGHHLLALINDILDLAKIEAGQITLDINKVDVNSVCQASLRMIKQLAQKKDQEVVFEIDRDLGLMWADERRLKQMIVNLLSNAVKFTPEAGKLGLEVRGDRAGNKVIITVWDNGIGISERDMNRLFRPFVQLDAGLAREATGTGLGLALVAQMARLHGGSVNVISEPGEGSRFSIQLPWEPALVADPAVRLRSTGKFRAIDPNAKNKPTILLIEDTREVVMMLVDYLEMAGFHMVTAQDGVDGLTQARLTRPNLILMDIQMPRMNGFETTEKLRSDPQFKDTPIIALTALAMPNDRQRCIEAGMDEYMSKPVNLKALVKMLHKFLLEDEEANR